MKIRQTMAVLMTALTLTGASLALAQDADARRREVVVSEAQQRSVTVTGEGVLRVSPDQATIHLVFRHRHESLQTAHENVQRDIQTFQNAVVAAGLPRDLVRSSSLRYSTEYVYESGQPPRPVAFNAESSVTLRTQNLADVPRLLELAIRVGAAEIPPVSYSLVNQAEAERQARALAMSAALERAEELAKGFNANVGQVLTIDEAQRTPTIAVRYARMESQAMVMDDGASFADVDPDSIEVRASVSATFALR